MRQLVKIILKVIIMVLLPLCMIAAYGSVTKNTWSNIKPKIYGDAVKMKIGKALRTYYSLYPDSPIVIEVTGPIRLRVITRVDFETAVSRDRQYEIMVYADDDKEGQSFKKTSQPSFISTFVELKDKTPGKIRDIYLDVPEGTHTLVFNLESFKDNTAVRMRFMLDQENGEEALERKNKEWNFLKPVCYEKEVFLYVEENKRDYFCFSAKKPLEIDAQGPATLKVLTRLEYEDIMKEFSDYNLAVYEDGNFKTEHFFQTERAKKVAYAEDQGLSAGLKQVFLLEVPEGPHHYRIELKSPVFASVLCRPFVRTDTKK